MSINNLPLSRSGKTSLQVATQAVQAAGGILLDHFSSQKTVKQKSRGNLVTDVDLLSEKLILDLLKVEFPDYKVLSEETNSSTAVTDYAWIIDPLDGTNNYVFGVPHFCVNIALVNNNDILLGITYDPLKRELFHAEKGKGTYLNGSPVKVSQIGILKDALVSFDLGYSDEQARKMLDIADALVGRVHSIRMMGSSALGLAYVACGRISLYFHRYVYPWDIASGLLLIREAGGEVVDWKGKPTGYQTEKVVASNNRLWEQFISDTLT